MFKSGIYRDKIYEAKIYTESVAIPRAGAYQEFVPATGRKPGGSLVHIRSGSGSVSNARATSGGTAR